MRNAITALALLTTAGLAFGTVYVLLKKGPDVFTLLGALVTVLFAIGILGALSQPPDRRR